MNTLVSTQRCMGTVAILGVGLLIGCDRKQDGQNETGRPGKIRGEKPISLLDARQGFKTRIVKSDPPLGPPDRPDGKTFQLIQYNAPLGKHHAYVTPDPKDGKKRPAIVWITGGDNNSIGDVWSVNPRSNDQSASAFRKAGIVMMFPSQRGGNNNPGKREGFFGEVDDVLAATNHLATLPYVDANQIYLGGHSTGGTLAMLVGECSDRYKAVFSLGPVATPFHYGGDFMYCDTGRPKEVDLRAPIQWLHSVGKPMYVFEGARDGNWDSIALMADLNENPNIKFFKVPGHDHFSLIAPLAELLSKQIQAGKVEIHDALLRRLR